MGDKSPKANQKHKAQQKAKADSAAQKKGPTGLSRQGGAEKEVSGCCQAATSFASPKDSALYLLSFVFSPLTSPFI